MPPRTRYTRDDLLSAALALVRRDGMDMDDYMICVANPLSRPRTECVDVALDVLCVLNARARWRMSWAAQLSRFSASSIQWLK